MTTNQLRASYQRAVKSWQQVLKNRQMVWGANSPQAQGAGRALAAAQKRLAAFDATHRS